jgi:2-oxo-4-hydroxy-4-carboxy-5-ureidoimidazoline decarboxylase
MTQSIPSAPDLNPISIDEASLKILCSSTSWQTQMLKHPSFNSRNQVVECAENAFNSLNKQDWLEAFAGHPMIGDLSSLKKKYSQGANLSAKEQSGATTAPEQVLQKLITLNQEYVERFGFIFIVCATGKSAWEMLQLLEERIHRSPAQELEAASQEQKKITFIRIDNLLSTRNPQEKSA